MARRDRSGSDSAGVGPDPASAAQLRRLSDVKGLDVASGEPDVRGWEVRTVGGDRLGRVDDLLVDESSREVVMLDVSLREGDRHIEVPIRSAQLDRSRHHVIIDSADTQRGETLQGESRLEREDTERTDISEGERTEDRERMEHMSAEDRLRAAERMRGERTLRGERTIREQGRPHRAAPASGAVEEVVVEQRPMVEETVVRRRPVGEEDLGEG